MGLLAVAPVTRAEVDLADLFAKTNPSVVTLRTYTAAGRKLEQGSGFIVDKTGVIVTCLHVVADAATVEIQTSDESTYVATAVIRSDKGWDIALLKVDPLTQPPLKLAPAAAVRIGAGVVAIGSPLGLGNTLSQGIISGLRPHEGKYDLIQVTTPISSGSSGGPILSAATGEVIGLTASTYTSGQNLNFAIPASVIADELATLDEPFERKLEDFTPDVKRALAEAKKVRSALELECTEADALIINTTIQDAITSGVGIYNNGDPLACYRIYEGAAYKILFRLANRSPTATHVLETALLKAEAVDNTTQISGTTGTAAKAWILRYAFDSISGIHGRKPPTP